MIRQAASLVALALLGVLGCDKKEAPAEPAPAAAVPAAAAAPAAAPAVAAEPAVDVASLPVEEQYEAEAEKEITADNLSAKLDELEKEISAP